jgi:nitroimidazol reductase NimA-like FMN-containing flavoprotein (pyridoxamine 5'-phosphate oxidase superfamily)
MLIQTMKEDECHSMLTRSRLGRLACAHENQPYIVPIYFAFEHPYLYAFTTPGQKVEWMRDNPLVCLEVDEVEDSENWTSVVVFGRYEELREVPERREPSLHALDLLNKSAGWWQPGCASSVHRDPPRPVVPVFYRICIDRISGRRATSTPAGPDRASPGSPTQDSQSRLRRGFQALSRLFAARRGIKKDRPSVGHPQ